MKPSSHEVTEVRFSSCLVPGSCDDRLVDQAVPEILVAGYDRHQGDGPGLSQLRQCVRMHLTQSNINRVLKVGDLQLQEFLRTVEPDRVLDSLLDLDHFQLKLNLLLTLPSK